MNIGQVITDYIRRSILTTQGDLPVRGAAQPERLAAGALGEVLRGQGAGSTPAWQTPLIGDMNMAHGVYVRSTSGNEVVSGVGFEPGLILFLVMDTTTANLNWSIGWSNGSFEGCLSQYDNGTNMQKFSAYALYIRRSAGNEIYGGVTEMGADGFTVTHTVSGVVGASVLWLAIG